MVDYKILEDKDALQSWVTSEMSNAKNFRSTWRESAIEDYNFYANEQWAPEDKAKLEAELRPTVTFNRIVRTINAITGLEIQNRQEVTYLPREVSDIPINTILTDTAKWIRDLCDAEDEESEGFEDAAVCGEGWTHTRIEYDEDPEGQILIERVDPLEMVVDPKSKSKNYGDACWVARIQQWSKERVKSEWPDFDYSGKEDIDFTDEDEVNDFFRGDDYGTMYGGSKKRSQKTVAVAEFEFFVHECVYSVTALDELGQSQGNRLLSQQDFENFIENAEKAKIVYDYAKLKRKKYYKVFICGGQIVDGPTLIETGKFTYNAITCFRNSRNGTYFGVVTLMKDPQRWANKWLSQIMHIVNSGAKNGYLVEEGAISDPRQFEEDLAKPGSNVYLTSGALTEGRIAPKQPPQYPVGVDRLLQYALESINDVPGVNVELLGTDTKDIPVAVALQRKQSGITILAPLFNSLRRYRKEQGRVLARFIQKYVPDGRLVRIMGPTGTQYIPYRKQANLEYDVVIDDAPTSANSKGQVFMVLSQMLPTLLQAGIKIPPEVLDYMPLPTDLTNKWKQLLSTPNTDPIQEQMKQMNVLLTQLTVDEKFAKNEETRSKTYLNQAKAQESIAVSHDEQAQANQKMGLAHAEDNRKTQQMILDNIRKDFETLAKIRRQDLETQAKTQRGNNNV